jgi:hypothetical protein
MSYAAFADAITNAYRSYLGRDPEAGQVDWRHREAATGKANLATQIANIQSSGEAQAFRARSQAPAPAPAPTPAPDPDAAHRAALEQEVGSLFGESGKLYDSMQSPVDVYNKAMESLGLADARTRVVGLREQLMNTENLLRNVDASVSGRTMDSTVTESQRQRLVAGEQQPLASQVDIFGRALEGALGDYGMIQQEGKTQAELTFQGEQAKRDALKDRLEIAISRSNNAEDKRRWGVELERLKAQDAEAKRQFDLELAQRQSEFNANLTLENQKLADARTSAARSGGTGGGGGGGSKSSQNQAQSSMYSFITDKANKLLGGDGYMSGSNYKALKSEWIAAGWSASAFDSAFKQFANPKWPKDYGF